MKRTLASLTIAAIAPLLLAPAAQAVEVGYEGCTPGYWKNHTDNWEEASPSKSFVAKFSGGSLYASTSTLTQLQALAGGGGSGLDGAARILARAAMAAYLNAANDQLGYPWRRDRTGLDGRPPLVQTVNDAFASGDRDTMLALAAQLDRDNNLGCSLS